MGLLSSMRTQTKLRKRDHHRLTNANAGATPAKKERSNLKVRKKPLETASLEERVIVLAPPAEAEAAFIQKALGNGGLAYEICADNSSFFRKVADGAGAALLTDECLQADTIALLQERLTSAPPWSDLPVLILTVNDASQNDPNETLASLGNVTYLERPIRAQTLVTAVRSALRARRRQYEVRDLLRRQEKAVERVDVLAEVASHLLLSDQPEEIVASVFRKIAAHLGLEVYLCYLYDEKTQKLRLSSQAGLAEAVAAARAVLDLRNSFCGAVAQQRKYVIAEQVQDSNDASIADIKALGMTAYACFPLLANGRLIGTLSFGLRRGNRLEHAELAMLETVCNQVAVAIERKRTEEALHELNQVLEKRVDDRTAQLQEINDQMEAFTYSISHDLRAPLRAIRGFAQALSEDYAASLDATGRDYLERMGDGAERLDRLIQDLLQYSRLSRSTLSFEPIPLENTVQRVLQNLEPDIRATDALIEVQRPLSRVLGHEQTLEQVLINLLSNALKFVTPGVKPHIRIWSTEESETARLWIGDNGIGIAPEHYHRIFGVFERLHSNDAYPGTGIGLAIVAKAVARMGGQAGVESAVGQGSRFWIELPRPPMSIEAAA